jgi:glycosyltransferase involved in cell wall biosynthesis
MDPLVTIGIAVYNGEKYIVDCLNSVNNQSYRNLEICIVDDASADDSYHLCLQWSPKSRFPVTVLQNKINLGLSATCNIILKHSQGKYLQLFDQDDLMLPDKIEKDVAEFEQLNEDVALIYSKLQLINEKGEILNQTYNDRIAFNGVPPSNPFTELIHKNFIPAPTVVLRNELVKKTGGYDETVVYNDWDMWLKLTKEYKIMFADRTTVSYRIHSNSIMAENSNQKQIERNEITIRMIKKHLGFKKSCDDLIIQKITELSIYSYFLGAKTAVSNLKWSLKNKFNLKIWFYHKMAMMGIPHPSKFKLSGR